MGGKITVGLACMWALGHILLWAMASGWIHLSEGVLATLACIQMALAFPLGFLGTGLASMDHGMTSSEGIRYLLLMVPNLFLQGYLLAGIWQFYRRFTAPLRRDFT
ncbi:hypothetical protein [Haloferula sp. BvORR071]|uniref:hypothetical protein n=1 Tax=Haloferula sp. BvORR071 TaxID=1396141 RepID=UPI002240EBFE|nr:hypothetical protein [Haloferula sp. BvORR071]